MAVRRSCKELIGPCGGCACPDGPDEAMTARVRSCIPCCLSLREAWGGRLAQLKQQELQEIAEAREKAAEVRQAVSAGLRV